MYKITLFDENCPSCCSGTVSYYCEDIDKFEEEWTKLEKDAEKIERFKRSKAGELVTDFYPTRSNEELNIVQEDKDARIYFEKDFVFKDKEIELLNSYRWPGEYYAKTLHIHVRYVQFCNEYLKLMTYHIGGMAMLNAFAFSQDKYEKVVCYGNKVLRYTNSDAVPFRSDRLEDFADSSIFCIVYIPVEVFSSVEDMKEDCRTDTISDEKIAELLIDIIGEAG